MMDGSGWNLNRQNPTRSCREDKLNRISFVNYVVNIIDNAPVNDRAFVVAINGKWGDGKTSVKNMIVENYLNNKNQDTIFFEYDCLDFQNRADLQRDFSSKLAKVARNNGIINKFFSKFYIDAKNPIVIALFLLSIFIFMKVFNLTLKNIFLNAYSFLWIGLYYIQVALFGNFSFAKIMESLQKILAKFDLLARIPTLTKGLNSKKLNNFIQKKFVKKTLVILIDTFDSLELNQINTLMKFLDINSQLSKCVFILFYDKDIVSSALKTSSYSGSSYLDKFINLQLDLPLVNNKTLFSFLQNELIEKYDIHIEYSHKFKFVKNYFSSLNDVYSFLDSFDLNYKITLNNLKGLNVNINKNDFFYLEVLRFFENNLYKGIRKNKLLLTCFDESIFNSLNDFEYSFDICSDRKNLFEKLFDGVVCEDNLDNLKALIFELFPLLKNFLEDKSENVAILNKTTVGIYDYFDFYFGYDLSEYVIQLDSFIKISSFLTNNNDFIKAFKETFYIVDDKLISLFSHKFLLKLNEKFVLLDNLNGLSIAQSSEFLKNLIWLLNFSDNVLSIKVVVNILTKFFDKNSISVDKLNQIFDILISEDAKLYLLYILEITFMIKNKYLYSICGGDANCILENKRQVKQIFRKNVKTLFSIDYMKYLLNNSIMSNLQKTHLFGMIKSFLDSKTKEELGANKVLNRMINSKVFKNIKSKLFKEYFELLCSYCGFIVSYKIIENFTYAYINMSNLYFLDVKEILEVCKKHKIDKSELFFKLLERINRYGNDDITTQKELIKKLFIKIE